MRETKHRSDSVRVDLGARSYDVRIAQGLIGRAGAEIAPLLARPRVWIVADARVAALHGPALEAALAEEGIASARLDVPPGEASKSWSELERVAGWLLADRVERRDGLYWFRGRLDLFLSVRDLDIRCGLYLSGRRGSLCRDVSGSFVLI